MKLIRNRGLLIITIIMVIILVAIMIITNSPQTPPSNPSPLPGQTITFKNIHPGVTTKSQLGEILGKPIYSQTTELSTITSYQSTYPQNPHIAVTVNRITTLFIEKVSSNKQKSLNDSLSIYGQPDIIKYSKEIGKDHTLSLYLNHGFGIVTHDPSRKITQIWYFQPQTIDNLLRLSPIKLVNTPITTFNQ